MVVYILIMYTQVQCTFSFTYSAGLLIVDDFKYYVELSKMFVMFWDKMTVLAVHELTSTLLNSWLSQIYRWTGKLKNND